MPGCPAEEVHIPRHPMSLWDLGIKCWRVKALRQPIREFEEEPGERDARF